MENKNENVITCVYCGMQYPSGTPSYGESCNVLTDHIKICEKHPMRKAEEKVEKLKKALGNLIGFHTIGELSEMESLLIQISDPEAQESLAAVRALKEVLESELDK